MGEHVESQLREQLDDVDITAVRTVATQAGNKGVHLVHEHISGRANVIVSESRSIEAA